MTKRYLRRWNSGLGCYVYLYKQGREVVEYSDTAKLRSSFSLDDCIYYAQVYEMAEVEE